MLAFEDARPETVADLRPLAPRLPWLGTVLGLILAFAGIATLIG